MKLTATLFFQPNTKRPRKYRNITNEANFSRFAATTGAWYINYYDQQTKEFKRRKWLINDFRKS